MVKKYKLNENNYVYFYSICNYPLQPELHNDPNIANDNVLSATVTISDQLTPRTIIALGGMVLMLSTLGFYHWKPEIVMEKNDDQL
jgi:hypothetical protein